MQKYYKFTTILITIMLIYSCDNSVVYNGSEKLEGMPVIEVLIDDDEYYYLLQDKTTKSDVPVTFIYSGERSTGFIRSTGGGSRMHPRWSYRVKLNDGYTLENLTSFSLSSQSLDPSMIHTAIVSRIYKQQGFPIFRNKHVFLKINNQDKGLYMILERVNEEFFYIRNMPVYELFKANLGADLFFNPADHPRFTYEKKLPEDDNYTRLFKFINAVETSDVNLIEQSLAQYVNIDNYIEYHAISSITNNQDAFKNNYFLYRPNAAAPYNFIPWDFDRSFDAFSDVGLAGDNTLFNKLIQNQNIRDKYKAEIQQLLDTSFKEEVIFPIIDSTAAHIVDAYDLDPFLGGGGFNLDTQVNQLKMDVSNRIRSFRANIENF